MKTTEGKAAEIDKLVEDMESLKVELRQLEGMDLEPESVMVNEAVARMRVSFADIERRALALMPEEVRARYTAA